MAIEADQPGEAGGDRRDPGADLASAYRAHAAALYRYAVLLTADAAMAEDAIHQVFMNLAGRRPSLPSAATEGFYLRRAVRNECYRLLARRGGAAPLDGANLLAPVGPGPADREEQAMLEQALRSLPPEQREVIHMKIYERMTFQQIADQTGESINTVAGRYRYGLEKLHRRLAPGREAIP